MQQLVRCHIITDLYNVVCIVCDACRNVNVISDEISLHTGCLCLQRDICMLLHEAEKNLKIAEVFRPCWLDDVPPLRDVAKGQKSSPR